MNKLQTKVGRKAAKATARHSVRGLGSKAKRQPIRSATLGEWELPMDSAISGTRVLTIDLDR